MTVKQFFKSTAFKCILVLTCIALVAGGLLAILNDVLYISPEERTQRAIKKIYGKEVGFSELVVNGDNGQFAQFATNQYGNIDSAFKLEDGNYLIKSTGTEGYKGGSVTTWIVAKFQDAQFKGLEKVIVESYDKQTLMSNFKGSFYEVYVNNNDHILSGGMFGNVSGDTVIGNLTSGATFSSNAVNRSVNCALVYIRNVLAKGGVQ